MGTGVEVFAGTSKVEVEESVVVEGVVAVVVVFVVEVGVVEVVFIMIG